MSAYPEQGVPLSPREVEVLACIAVFQAALDRADAEVRRQIAPQPAGEGEQRGGAPRYPATGLR